MKLFPKIMPGTQPLTKKEVVKALAPAIIVNVIAWTVVYLISKKVYEDYPD